jgi:hypothetical protein
MTSKNRNSGLELFETIEESEARAAIIKKGKIHYKKLARKIYAASEADGISSRIKTAIGRLEEELRRDYKAAMSEDAGGYGGLLGVAYGVIDWLEIANDLFEDVETD